VYELAARFHTRCETIYRNLRAHQAINYPIVGDADSQREVIAAGPGGYVH
jgi:hypothetical protein